MITDKQRKNLLIRKILNLPIDKINEIDKLILKEDKPLSDKQIILSLAGAWHDLDDETFADFTVNLTERRESNRQRIS